MQCIVSNHFKNNFHNLDANITNEVGTILDVVTAEGTVMGKIINFPSIAKEVELAIAA